MKFLKLIGILSLVGLVSACADTRVASRNAPYEPVAAPVMADVPLSVSVNEIRVRVPKSLRATEATASYPSGDIVWRGEPFGDRHQQVAQVMYDGLRTGADALTGAIPVNLDIEVLRFHALTETARYSTGGVHNIIFALRVTDAETGLPLREVKVVKADLRAFGGYEAIAADQRGETQRVRIVAHLAKVIQEALTLPDGHQNANLGLLQRINRL